MRHQNRRHGFTLTEVAIVLGIMGSILGAIWVAAGHVGNADKVQKANGQIMQILSNYRTLYSQHGIDVSNGTDVTCLGVTSGFFPVDMVPSGATCTASASGTTTYTGTSLLNPWSGQVGVSVSQTTSGIQISYLGLPQSACIGLASAATNSGDLTWEEVGSAAHSQSLPPFAATTPYTPTQIATFCTATNTNVVEVMYKAR